MSNSWPSRCPSCDQSLLPCCQVVGRCGHGVCVRRLVGMAGVLLSGGNFFTCNGWWWWWHGGSEGIGGMGRDSHRRSDLHSSHTTTLHRGWSIVFTTCRNIVRTLQSLFTTRCFLKEESVHDHVAHFENFFDKETLKERSFTFERTCFDITFCTGSGRRTPALQCVKNLYGTVTPPVDVVRLGVRSRILFDLKNLLTSWLSVDFLLWS
jgi:hypothetical protein